MNLGKRRARRENRAAVGLVLPGDVQYGSDCGAPNRVKILAQTVSLLANASHTFRFTTPGAFCPTRIYILNVDPPAQSFVSSIRIGLDEQIIQNAERGQFPLITRELFSINNNCCPVLCMPCVCMPGVPLELTYRNGTGADTITVVVYGTYLDASDPQYATQAGCPPRFLGSLNAPGCPPDGGDKLVGFGRTVGAGDEAEVVIETSGRFCPRQMILATENSDFFQVTEIKSGIKHQIIRGSLPADLFTIDNECCTLACFDCLCAPGYPLTIKFRNTDSEGARFITGALVGSYEDACP